MSREENFAKFHSQWIICQGRKLSRKIPIRENFLHAKNTYTVNETILFGNSFRADVCSCCAAFCAIIYVHTIDILDHVSVRILWPIFPMTRL